MTKIEIINLVLNSLTAVGTVSAVIVALVLAGRNERLKLSVTVAIYDVIGHSVKSQLLRIVITNQGLRKVKIAQIGWVTGITKKTYAIQTYDQTFLDNALLPKELEDGETLYISLPWNSFKERAIPEMVSRLKSKFMYKSKSFLNFYVYTSILNKGIKANISDDVRNVFISEVNKSLGKLD